MLFDVLVPVPGSPSAQIISPGSAVVSPQDEPGPREGVRACHYEGNIYDVDCLRTFGSRLMHAAGRAQSHYPTIAKGWHPESELVVVGRYDLSSEVFTLTGDRSALEEWLGHPLSDAELSC
jgi:hypothetical protein